MIQTKNLVHWKNYHKPLQKKPFFVISINNLFYVYSDHLNTGCSNTGNIQNLYNLVSGIHMSNMPHDLCNCLNYGPVFRCHFNAGPKKHKSADNQDDCEGVWGPSAEKRVPKIQLRHSGFGARDQLTAKSRFQKTFEIQTILQPGVK